LGDYRGSDSVFDRHPPPKPLPNSIPLKIRFPSSNRDSVSIASLLKTAGADAGFRVRALAERVRKPDGTTVSPSYITDIEKGRGVPSDYVARQLAAALRDRPKRWLAAAQRSREGREAPE